MLKASTDIIKEWEDSLPGPEVGEIAHRIFGKADWLYDHELGVYLPCCSHFKWMEGKPRKCGNGPLTREEIATGECSNGPHLLNPPA